MLGKDCSKRRINTISLLFTKRTIVILEIFVKIAIFLLKNEYPLACFRSRKFYIHTRKKKIAFYKFAISCEKESKFIQDILREVCGTDISAPKGLISIYFLIVVFSSVVWRKSEELFGRWRPFTRRWEYGLFIKEAQEWNLRVNQNVSFALCLPRVVTIDFVSRSFYFAQLVIRLTI